jgi:hypothetical protein
MAHRSLPPQIRPGPLSMTDAAAINDALRYLYQLLGGFDASPPLSVVQDAGGIHIRYDQTATITPATQTAAVLRAIGGDSTLVSNLSSSAGSMSLKTFVNFGTNGYGYGLIGSELIQTTSSNVGYPYLTGINRGVLGTSAGSWSAGAIVRSATYLTAPVGSNDTTIQVQGSSGEVFPLNSPFCIFVGNQNSGIGEPMQVLSSASSISGPITLTVKRLGFGSYPVNTPVTLWIPYTPNTCGGIYGPGSIRQATLTSWSQGGYVDSANVFISPTNTTCDSYYVPLVNGRRYSGIVSSVPFPILGTPVYEVQTDSNQTGWQQLGGIYTIGGSIATYSPVCLSMAALEGSDGSLLQSVTLSGWPQSGPGLYGLLLPTPLLSTAFGDPVLLSGRPSWLITVSLQWAGYGILSNLGPEFNFGAYVELDLFANGFSFYPPSTVLSTTAPPVWTSPPYAPNGTNQGATVPSVNFFGQAVVNAGTLIGFGLRSTTQYPGNFTGTVSVMPFPYYQISAP